MLNKMSYAELREKIYIIFYDLLNREFDNEFLETQTDEVLRIIQQQGGQI